MTVHNLFEIRLYEVDIRAVLVDGVVHSIRSVLDRNHGRIVSEVASRMQEAG